MTANMIKGRGFRGALRYNLDKVNNGVAQILTHSFVEAKESTIMKEVQMIRSLRPNLQKYFYHTSINFPLQDKVSNETLTQVAYDYLAMAGFDQHQFIIFRHTDTAHPHIHILVNRIGYDGKVLSDSNDFSRTESVLRVLENRYHLTTVPSSKQAATRALKKNEWEMKKRTGAPSNKEQLQLVIRQLLRSKKQLTCTDFIRALREKGIQPQFNVASTGYVSGISYAYNGFVTTGSKLGADFKWTTLKHTINYDQQRDRTLIESTNAVSPASQGMDKTDDVHRQETKSPSAHEAKTITPITEKPEASSAKMDDWLRNISQPTLSNFRDDPQATSLQLPARRRKRRKRKR